MDTGSHGPGGRRRVNKERDAALLEAEVRRVLVALAPYGVMRRDALARACGARRWGDGQFQGALDAAVRAGRLRSLPFGFYARATRTAGERQWRR
jgi:hypothetical protein